MIFHSLYRTVNLACNVKLLSMKKSTLVQVMACCHYAKSHYLSQCWHRSVSPYSITRPQRVNTLKSEQNGQYFAKSIFKCIFWNETVDIWIEISIKYVPLGPIYNKSAFIGYLNQCLPRCLISQDHNEFHTILLVILKYVFKMYKKRLKQFCLTLFKFNKTLNDLSLSGDFPETAF